MSRIYLRWLFQEKPRVAENIVNIAKDNKISDLRSTKGIMKQSDFVQ